MNEQERICSNIKRKKQLVLTGYDGKSNLSRRHYLVRHGEKDFVRKRIGEDK